MPSPLRKNRPITLLYPHRKLSRPWLVSLHEDLWKDGPSGDGPGDDLWSKLIPSAKSHVGYMSESEYKTHSPSAEDFFTSLPLPFPTVIDTMMDESSTFGEEMISRTSMPYEGPSSLLNSFIFRPSLPYISPSSIKTPTLEESSVDSESVFLSWWDPSSVWKMSTRQAVSDALSDRYFIITAISATHIYGEGERTSYSDSIPSKFPTEISSSFSTLPVQENLVTTKTDNLVEVPSPVSSTTMKMLPAFSLESQFYSSVDNVLSSSLKFDHSHPFEEVYSPLKSKIFSDSSNISLSHLQTYFYSNTLSGETDMPYILTQSKSNDFDNTIFRDLSPYADISDYRIDRSTGSSFEQTWVNSISPMNTKILYDFNVSFYTTSPFKSFLTSNIQTTVTYVDYDSQSDRFIMPTLTIQGTPSIRHHSNDLHETDFSSSHPEKGTVFPHIASSFTDLNDIIPVISLWPLDISSVENIISREDTRTYTKEDSYFDESLKVKLTSDQIGTLILTSLTSRPIFSPMYSLFSDNEITNEHSSPSELSKFRFESTTADDEHKTLSTEQFDQNYTPSRGHMFSPITPQQASTVTSSMQSWTNDIEAYESLSFSGQSIPISLSHPKGASMLSVNMHSADNASIPVLTPISYLTTSSSVYSEDPFTSVLIPSTGPLTVNYESQQEITPTAASALEIMSTNDETSYGNENLQTQDGSASEFIDPSTHHVTVRSLSSSSLIDISESMLLNYVTSRDSDIGVSKLTSTHTLSSIIIPSESFENITKLEEKTLLQEINTQEYSPTFLESSFQEYENFSHTSLISAKYNVPGSQRSQELESNTLSRNQSVKGLEGVHPSLSEKEFVTPLSFSVHSHLYEMTPLFTITSEDDSKSKLIESYDIHISTLYETLRAAVSVTSEDKHFFLTKTVAPEAEFTSYPFETTKDFHDSQIYPTPGFEKNVSKYEDLIPASIFANQSVIKSNESFNGKLESPVTDKYTNIRPSKTFQDSSDRSKLGNIGSGHLFTDKLFTQNDGTPGDEYLPTSKRSDSEIKIEPSMTFSHLMESEQTKIRHTIRKEDISMSGTTYFETPLIDGSMTFSTKDYLSEDFLHLSNSISEGDILKRIETYLDSYHLTPTIPWEVSRHIEEYSTPKPEDRGSSFAQLLSEEGLSLVSYAAYVSPVFGSDSRNLASLVKSSYKSELSYSLSDFEGTLYPSDIQSSSKEAKISYYLDKSLSSKIFPITSPSFTADVITTVHSFPISPTIVIERSELSMDKYTSPRYSSDLFSEILLQRSSGFRPHFPSEQESEYDFHTLKVTPDHPVATQSEFGWNGKLNLEFTSKYLDSSIGFTSVPTSRDESESYYHTPELTLHQTIVTQGESFWVDGQRPGIGSKLESSSKFTDGESDIPHYTPVFTPRNPISTLEKSIWIDGLLSETDSSDAERLASFTPDFTSEGSLSLDRQVPEITLDHPVTAREKSSMADVMESEIYHSKVGLSHLVSFGVFTSKSFSTERDSNVYQTPEMTPSQSLITDGISHWIGGPHPEGELQSKKEISISSGFTPAFTSEERSAFYQTPVFSPSQSMITHGKSHWIGGPHPEGELQSKKELGVSSGFSPAFTSEERSAFYQTPVILQSHSLITHGKSHWIGGPYPEGELQSKKELSVLPGFTPAFTSGESSAFYQTPVFLPSGTVTKEKPKCTISACLVAENESQNIDMTIVREGGDLLRETLPLLSTFHPIITSQHATTENILSSSLHKSSETFKSEDFHKTREPMSVESEHPARKTELKITESDYSLSQTYNYSVRNPDPKGIESGYSIKIPDPMSIDSDLPVKRPDPKSIDSDLPVKRPDPKSIDSDLPVKRPDPKSIDSDLPVKRPDPKSIDYDLPVKRPDPKSIESDHLQFSIPLTKSVVFSSTLTLFPPNADTSLPMPTPVLPIATPTRKETSKPIATSVLDVTELTPVWQKEISTPGFDIEMASVLAISSFFGINGSRNANTSSEKSGISESEWSNADVKPTPSIDLTLFKDNNYWILTVLETPVKGHLPENFSQTLEIRLANAYSEAFRIRSSKHGSNAPEDNIVVKILSMTNDLLLSQLDIVYVVERGGMLVPASIASEFLNFLRHEQLREFLGLYAILKAKPYRPDESTESHPVSSAIPVVTIVCSILGFLLFIFCCFCVYCRCCRPKQAEDPSPTSSTSGSLQRSLAKHGQHNRKHLFQEMAHHLTTEMAAQRKQECAAPDIFVPEKEPPAKSLPPLPLKEHAKAIDKAVKMLKILENKDASTSPIKGKRSVDKDKSTEAGENAVDLKKAHPKPKKRRKAKESQESSTKDAGGDSAVSELRPLPPAPKEEEGKTPTAEENRASPDSGTSSRHTTSSPASASEKTSEELGSYGSNAELLPPLQDLIAKSKADSEAAAADTQIHLSRVRQRISELLDDAFALANGRKFYGSMRSKKIGPASEMFPRYGSLRSQSAAESSVTRQQEETASERRPISEGAQHLLGTITDDGQLITKPPPKSVWGHQESEETTTDTSKYPEVTEAHNRHVNFFPFQQQSKLQQISASSTSSLPVLDTLQESQPDMTASTLSTINVLREAASEVYLAHSSKIHPAVVDQYDEIDVVSALREGEPVADLIRAIKDELQKFSGTLPGTNNESNA